jgi:hypothetical protein
MENCEFQVEHSSKKLDSLAQKCADGREATKMSNPKQKFPNPKTF